MRLSRLYVLAAFVVVPVAAAQPSGSWEGDFDDDTKAWKEIQAQIPPYPKDQNLVLVEAGGATPHRFYVDTASVSLGDDGIVRYTTVVKTAGGATNVSFEGMRCETREQKLYALGRSDGTWVRARKPEWQRVVLRDLQPHRHTLYREFFCPIPARPTPAKQAVEALRRGVGLSSSQTMAN
jgi:hypothetical protein